jgi:hypothetical protein
MDGLALLCNLFADGPVTLARLRGARLATQADLERVPGERLAGLLHASVPQARAFADEARKLVRRLAEVGAEEPRPHAPILRPVVRAADAHALVPETPAGATLLRPGLLPGLDEALCARLVRQHVRTVQALGEFAGLELARRTGIPYSKLLELARQARRFATPPLCERRPAARAPELASALRSERGRADRGRADERALPREEPLSSGPFV